MAVDLAPLVALRAQGKLEEARVAAAALAAQHADDTRLHFFTACIHDALGLEAQALPYYRACLAGDELPDALRTEAYVASAVHCVALAATTKRERCWSKAFRASPGTARCARSSR